MDLEILEKIKKTTIIALFSDDELMETLVLKGGNAIDIFHHNISQRGSLDIDLSIEKDFEESPDKMEKKFSLILKETFKNEGYKVFDLKLKEKPKRKESDNLTFWSGYQLEFKLILETLCEKEGIDENDIEAMRKYAHPVGKNRSPKFLIDISKYEFCKGKESFDLEGYKIYVYSPAMIVFEKTRAICQQTEDYKKIIKSRTRKPRAKDFFDIYILMENYDIDLQSRGNLELLKGIFDAKKVPLKLIKKIREDKNFHETDFVSVKDTVKAGVDLKEFDFYFNYVLGVFENVQF